MKGLILKDLYTLKKQSVVFLALIVFYMAFSFLNGGASIFGGVLSVVSAMLPVTALAFDERAKWDRYALTMPVSRSDLVLCKYLLGLILMLTAFVLNVLFQILGGFAPPLGALQSSLVMMTIGVLYLSLMMPLLFHFGVEKGRILMFIVLLIPMAAFLVLSGTELSLPLPELFLGSLWLPPAAAALIFSVSLFISLTIYEKKEFS